MLPTAPEYAETEQQLYPINEITQINAEDFRLEKISDLQTELMKPTIIDRSQKKYKRTHSITHIPAVRLGSLSAGLSSATLATALTGFGIVASPALAGVATVFATDFGIATGFGIVASPALAGVATVFGLFSVGFAAISERLESNEARKDIHISPC